MKLQLIRHATIWLEYAGTLFLIDPMFSEAGANPPIMNSGNDRRNPLAGLPSDSQQWLRPDAVLVSHLHADHWDRAAAQMLSKSLSILCQPGDEAVLSGSGFASVTVVDPHISFGAVTIHRTGGQHGTGEIGQRMGRVSGFVFQAAGEPTLYIAGDTIWCEDVSTALDTYHPDVTVVNAGGARFVAGDPITMDADDVIDVCRYAPYTKVVAVHMDTINHCLITRADLRQSVSQSGLAAQVVIPKDGDWYEAGGLGQ